MDNQTMLTVANSESVLFAQKADKLIAKNLIEEALQLCEDGVKAFPLYADGHYTLGRCYELSQRFDEAKNEYERTLYYTPGHIQALRALARIYFRNNLAGPGYALLLKASLLNPLDTGLEEELKANNLEPLVLGQDGAVSATGKIKADAAITEEAETALREEEHIVAEGEEHILEEAEQEPEREEPLIEITDEHLADVPEAAPQEPEEGIPSDISTAPEEIEMPESPVEETAVEKPDVVNGMIETEQDNVPVTPDETTTQLFIEQEETAPPELDGSTEEEKNAENHHPDLNQFDNVHDDFSTLMEDIFRPIDEEEDEDWAEEMKDEEEILFEDEHEQLVEEKPILDTSVIFQEEKRMDKEIEGVEQVEDRPEEVSEKPAAAQIPKESVLPDQEEAADKRELPIATPASSDNLVEDDLTEVIEQIEQSDEPVIEAEPEPAEEAVVEQDTEPVDKDDETVNIEDIMSNPSLLTPTFGEILIAQKKFEDARRVFIELAKRDPENPRIKKKIEFLDKLVAINKN